MASVVWDYQPRKTPVAFLEDFDMVGFSFLNLGRAQATQVQKHIESNHRDDQVWLLLRQEHRGWGCLPACPLRGLADSVQRESAIKVVISPMLWFSCWLSLVL